MDRENHLEKNPIQKIDGNDIHFYSTSVVLYFSSLFFSFFLCDSHDYLVDYVKEARRGGTTFSKTSLWCPSVPFALRSLHTIFRSLMQIQLGVQETPSHSVSSQHSQQGQLVYPRVALSYVEKPSGRIGALALFHLEVLLLTSLIWPAENRSDFHRTDQNFQTTP